MARAAAALTVARLVARAAAALTVAALGCLGGSAHASEILVAPGATGQALSLSVANPSELLWLHGTTVVADTLPAFVLNFSPASTPTSPSDIPPGMSGTAGFTFDVNALTTAGTVDSIVFKLVTGTADTARAAVRLVVGALGPVASVPYGTDLESGNASYLGADGWQWGTPTSGPGSAPSGARLWATNLAGDYANDEQALLYLVPFNLAGTTAPRLSFKHWFDTEWRFDGGVVQVSTDSGATFVDLAPVGGYPGRVGDTPAYTGRSDLGNAFRTATFLLGDHTGQVVVPRLVLASDGSITRPGWYVDDFAVTEGPPVDAAVTAITQPSPVVAAWPGGVSLTGQVANLGSLALSFRVRAEVDTLGDPPGSNAVAFRDSVTVGHLAPNASTSVSFPIPIAPLGFRPYLGRLIALASADADHSNDTLAVSFTPLPLIPPPVHDSFEGSGALGAATGVWGRGTPIGGPGAALRGAQCWGASLAGGYPEDHVAQLYLGAFDFRALVHPALAFYQWYDLESGYDGARVAVSTDGVVWNVRRPEDGYTAPVIAFDGDSAWTGASGGWRRTVFDLAPYAGAVPVVARLTLASDGSGPRPGWFVDTLIVDERSAIAGVGQEAPLRLELSAPRPTPSRGPLVLSLWMPSSGRARLRIYSVDGRLVATPFDESRAAGEFAIPWNGRRADGSPVASGVYFFKLEALGRTIVRRGVIVK